LKPNFSHFKETFSWSDTAITNGLRNQTKPAFRVEEIVGSWHDLATRRVNRKIENRAGSGSWMSMFGTLFHTSQQKKQGGGEDQIWTEWQAHKKEKEESERGRQRRKKKGERERDREQDLPPFIAIFEDDPT
jgi:hypothetical protein